MILITYLLSYFLFWNTIFVFNTRALSDPETSFCKSKLINSKLYYTDSSNNPFITLSEKNELIRLAKARGDILIDEEKKEFDAYKLLFLLPRMRGLIDSVEYDSLLKVSNKSIDWHVKYTLLTYDAVIAGTVINIDYEQAKQKCLYYKTTYYVVINEIFESHSNIHIGDTVSLKFTEGYVGKCDSKNSNLFSVMSDVKSYKKGEKNIFLLSHNEYYSNFIKNSINQNNKYEDVYCPDAFQLTLENEYYDISKENVLEKLNQYSNKNVIR